MADEKKTKKSSRRGKLVLLILLAVVVIAGLAALPLSSRVMGALARRTKAVVSTITTSKAGSTTQPGSAAFPISRGVPAFSSGGYEPASSANDNSFDTFWRSQGAPAWLAYDLSRVPASRRERVLVLWYNESTNYDHTLINNPTYNTPQDYTIEVNSASGGGNPPQTGWRSLVTERGNHYHSRQYVLNMAGYNWLRMNVTANDGAAENYDTQINLDVYDASTALADDWMFYGDSITAGAMGHTTLGGVAAFAQLINARVPDSYPAQEDGGTGYLTSSDAVSHLSTWLGLFPGKYVGLSYGTNDALGCVNPATFYQNYATMVQEVLHAGKIPLVPLIPWGKNANIQRCAPALNAQITALYHAFPQIIHGPDLWSFFQAHQNLISQDTIHPGENGFGAYRQQWASTLLNEVYHAPTN